MQPRYIFISGCPNLGNGYEKNVQRYDTLTDRWKILPELNIGRVHHSSCTLGNTLYVLGGEAFADEMIN